MPEQPRKNTNIRTQPAWHKWKKTKKAFRVSQKIACFSRLLWRVVIHLSWKCLVIDLEWHCLLNITDYSKRLKRANRGIHMPLLDHSCPWCCQNLTRGNNNHISASPHERRRKEARKTRNNVEKNRKGKGQRWDGNRGNKQGSSHKTEQDGFASRPFMPTGTKKKVEGDANVTSEAGITGLRKGHITLLLRVMNVSWRHCTVYVSSHWTNRLLHTKA